MGNINPLEVKIIGASVAAAMVAPTDNIIKFLIPIASGIVWVFLQPSVVKLRDEIKKRRKKYKNL